jgi:pimeloyl-ACP methyl ester carboxylesterase
LSLVESAKLIEELANVPFDFMAGSTKSRVTFVSTGGGTLALWSLNPETDDKLRLTSKSVAHVADPRHDSDLVYFARDMAKGAELHKICVTDAVHAGEKLALDGPDMRVEGLATAGRMIAFTASSKDDVGLLTVSEPGGAIEKRAKFEMYVALTDASKDYLVGFGSIAKNPRSSEVFIFKLASGEKLEFTPRAGSANNAALIRGSKILFESNVSGKNTLHLYDIESEELYLVPHTSQDHLTYSATEYPHYGWTDYGKVWSIGKRTVEAGAFVDGKDVPTPPGYLQGMSIMGDRTYVSHITIAQPMKILEFDLSNGTNRVIVDNPLARSISQIKRRTRSIQYESFDGKPIQAFVIDDGTDVPKRTIVCVHGGPWSDIINTCGVFMNSFNLSGYNIIASNFRGSTGYGEDFRNLDVGDPGGGDLQDVLYATKWAEANGVATECAIAGYSYGGYMTLLALGKEPDVWKCGVAGAPVADWQEMRTLSDASYRNFIDVLFDNRTELMAERSPKSYAKIVKNPVCIIISQNDSRTPIKAGPQLRHGAAEQRGEVRVPLDRRRGTLLHEYERVHDRPATGDRVPQEPVSSVTAKKEGSMPTRHGNT